MTTVVTSAQVGDRLPPLVFPPLTRATLALYAGGSGDHLPLHIDSDFATSAGYPDVFMHGMLGVAWIARMLTNWVPQEWLREIAVRFTAITYPGEVLTANGTITACDADGVAGRMRIEVRLQNAAGETKIAGEAVVQIAAGAN